jgi:predicted nucleic acid-binding protein
MWTSALIDSCVIMDAFLAFRKSHENARNLLELLAQAGVPCIIPAHAYFEFAVASIVRLKREPDKLKANPIRNQHFTPVPLWVWVQQCYLVYQRPVGHSLPNCWSRNRRHSDDS